MKKKIDFGTSKNKRREEKIRGVLTQEFEIPEIVAQAKKDASKIYIYVCDYVEYMDEIKGYYWSDEYEEKKKTKTYKEYLDERSLYHAEVSFEK